MADCVHKSYELDDKEAEHFEEYERKFAVDSTMLPDDLGKPFFFLQIYPRGSRGEGKREVSYRYIPKSGQAIMRVKDKSKDGTRDKMHCFAEVAAAKSLLKGDIPVAIKLRYVVTIHGRAWYIDYRPETKTWGCETEFNTLEAMETFRDSPFLWPMFITKDITEEEQAYTRSAAKTHSPKELAKWEKVANEVATSAKYEPPKADDSDVEWLDEEKDEPDEPEEVEDTMMKCPHCPDVHICSGEK